MGGDRGIAGASQNAPSFLGAFLHKSIGAGITWKLSSPSPADQSIVGWFRHIAEGGTEQPERRRRLHQRFGRLRWGEICGLTWDRVNLERRFLIVMEGKTRAARREIPLSPRAIDILESLPKSEKVFDVAESTLDATFRRAKQKAMILDATFHDSRATAITRLAKKLDILSLARMVGHKDLRMLQIYYRESAEDIAKRL